MSTVKHIYFVRHGEAEGNIGHFSQQPDTPLTARGIIQADQVAERLSHLKLDALVASHFVRAQQTATQIFEKINLPIETCEYFAELANPKKYWGMPHASEEYQAYQQTLLDRYTDSNWTNDDGENFSEIFERCQQGADFLEQHAAQNMAVVSHGRFARFFAAFILHQKELTAEIERQTHQSMVCTNTGITHFTIEAGRWKLITWNDHAHFAE